MLIVKNGHSADKLPDAARKTLALLGLNERQIDDVQKILGAKEFVTCNEENWSVDAAERILTRAWRGPCVAKVGDSMIVATKRDTIESLANKLLNDQRVAVKQQRKETSINNSEARPNLLRKMSSPIPDLAQHCQDLTAEKLARIIDARYLANTCKSVAEIKRWGLLPSFEREEALPGLENSYYGNSLSQLVGEASEVFVNNRQEAFDQRAKKIQETASNCFAALTSPTAKWIASLLAALSLNSLISYRIGRDPTNASSEKTTVDLVEKALPTLSKLPYEQLVPLDLYGGGQIAKVRLLKLENAQFEGAPAFRASFELTTQKGLTWFYALGSEKSQGLGQNYLTVSGVRGVNSGNFQVCSEAANGCLRGFALRIPETFPR